MGGAFSLGPALEPLGLHSHGQGVSGTGLVCHAAYKLVACIRRATKEVAVARTRELGRMKVDVGGWWIRLVVVVLVDAVRKGGCDSGRGGSQPASKPIVPVRLRLIVALWGSGLSLSLSLLKILRNFSARQ